MEENKEKKSEPTEEKQQRKVKRVFFAARSLPTGAVVKVEQNETQNIKISVQKDDKKESVVLTPVVAKALQGLLAGCMDSK